MPGLDPNVVAHALNVELGVKPVIQPMQTFHPDIEAQIIKEVQTLLAAGFIRHLHPLCLIETEDLCLNFRRACIRQWVLT